MPALTILIMKSIVCIYLLYMCLAVEYEKLSLDDSFKKVAQERY